MTRYHLFLTVLAVAIVVMAMWLAPREPARTVESRDGISVAGVAQLAERRLPLWPPEAAGSNPVSGPLVPSSEGAADTGPSGGSLNSPTTNPSLIIPKLVVGPVQLDDGGGISSALQSGTASWYRDPRKSGLYAAVPSYRFGDAPYKVRVCRTGSGRCVVVTVSDFCGCPGRRIVDLSPSAFQRLAALSVGLVAVTVAYPDGPLPTPPATDR